MNKEQLTKNNFIKALRAHVLGANALNKGEALKFPIFPYYLGTPRKVKRVINALKMSGINPEGRNFLDVNDEDLVYLFLIYIYHPEIFRDIYQLETGGSRGYFSVITKYDYRLREMTEISSILDGATQANSSFFKNYLRKTPEPARSLLIKLFDIESRLKSESVDSFERLGQDKLAQWSCFNGSMGTNKNLEDYLKFIANQAYSPEEGTQRKEYVNLCKEIFKTTFNARDVADHKLLRDKEFKKVDLFSTVLFQELEKRSDLSIEHIKNIEEILFELNRGVPYVSVEAGQEGRLFQSSGSGKLPLRLVYLVNEALRVFKKKSQYNEWVNSTIFGESSYIDRLLALEEPGFNELVALRNALAFRLYLSIDRGGQTFNVAEALYDLRQEDSIRVSVNHNKEFLLKEMEGVTKYLFQKIKPIFLEEPTKESNLLRKVVELKLEDVFGEAYVTGGDNSELLWDVKGSIASFVVYQIAASDKNVQWGQGLPMGGYKYEDREINEHFVDYIEKLFEVDPEMFWFFACWVVLDRQKGSEKTITVNVKLLNSIWPQERRSRFLDGDGRLKKLVSSAPTEIYVLGVWENASSGHDLHEKILNGFRSKK